MGEAPVWDEASVRATALVQVETLVSQSESKML